MYKIIEEQQGTRTKRRKKQKAIRKNRIILLILLIIVIIAVILINRKDDNIETSSTDTQEIQDGQAIEASSQPEINSKITDWNLILVNKDNKLPEGYNAELETVEYSHKIDKRAAENLRAMLSDARKEGLSPLVVSSYRTHETQETLYSNKVKQYKNKGYSQNEAEEQASYWVAIPGTSEHEVGLAVDIVGIDYQVLDEKQEKTEIQKWLMENCYKYGFILRYPTEKKDITKINYEPWHYRYVGVEDALIIKEKGYCLEEYIDYLKVLNGDIQS